MQKTSFLALLGKRFPEKLSGLSVKGEGGVPPLSAKGFWQKNFPLWGYPLNGKNPLSSFWQPPLSSSEFLFLPGAGKGERSHGEDWGTYLVWKRPWARDMWRSQRHLDFGRILSNMVITYLSQIHDAASESSENLNFDSICLFHQIKMRENN